MVKILHIVASQKSGVSRETNELTGRLSRYGIECEVCVLTELNMRSMFSLSTHILVRRIIRRFRPDIVHTWDSFSQFFGAVHCGAVPLIAERREPSLLPGMMQSFIHKKTARYIVPRKEILPREISSSVVPPGALPIPHAESLSSEKLLEKLEIPMIEPGGYYCPVFQSEYIPDKQNYASSPPQQSPLIIGIVLPLQTEHRILDALWIFETFLHVHLNYHAFIIGSGTDQELFLRCRDRWKLFSRVHFLGDSSEAYRLMPSFDVLLHLSSAVSQSGTILSAMSCGVPVVAIETPESSVYIQDGVSGFLIPCEGDFRYYRRTAAKRLLYIGENTALRRDMTIAAKKQITENFNFDAAVKQRMQIYSELLESNRSTWQI